RTLSVVEVLVYWLCSIASYKFTELGNRGFDSAQPPSVVLFLEEEVWFSQGLKFIIYFLEYLQF
ncbi:MAG: hypothetical protein P1P88_26430, partial [Bacteroidales bacterium]|nr:hypothetical protein [Bacteroidales bacterium]